ncbi:17772_t:CDS:2, partial [Dentiscutata erythropus]
MLIDGFVRLGEQKVAVKRINTSPNNSETFIEPIALIESAISCRSDVVNFDVLKCYGLSKLPNTNSYLIITELCKYDLWKHLEQNFGNLDCIILNKERPQTDRRNVFVPDCYKELMEQCWDDNPSNRPNINQLYEILRG